MIYEWRAYYIMPGRMPDIQRRFADHTMRLFQKHGIKVVGFWQPVIGESNELVYMCAYEDIAARDRAWTSFMADPAPALRGGTADMMEAVMGDIDSAIPVTRGRIESRTYQ